VSDQIVGIDLGTSNSVVACVDELDIVRVLADVEGDTIHPSVVSFHPSGGVDVGYNGKQRQIIDPKNTIYSAKRMIGQPFSSHAVRETALRVPFQIKEGPNELPLVVTRAGEFAIPEISALVLEYMGAVASKAIGSKVSRAVVTVPASFTDVQRSSTATAGALAGLNVVRVLNEPTAAAVAYGSTRQLNEIIAVYDFGGGTFDITILKLEDQIYTVLGTSGDAFLGGQDMDDRLVDQMVEEFKKQHRVDLRTDDRSIARLRAVAEHTKKELSTRTRVAVRVEELAYGPGGTLLDLEMKVSREQLVASIGDLVERTFSSCREAIGLAGISVDLIADVILVGGTTRIPYVREQVARLFKREPRTDMNPDHAIATGAALQAASIERVLSRTTSSKSPLSVAPAAPRQPPQRADFFGDLFGDRAVPPPPVENRAAPAPAKEPARLPQLEPIDVELDLDPDPEPQRMQRFLPPAPQPEPPRIPPASAHPPRPKPGPARKRSPSRMPTSIVDVTPRGLGIATVAGFCETLIRRNAQVPMAVKRSFVTSRNDQQSVRITVYQGESRRLADNVVVGVLVALDLPARPRGETSIEVEFLLDASSILEVSAHDTATGAEQRVKLDLKGGMAPEDIAASRGRLQALSKAPKSDE